MTASLPRNEKGKAGVGLRLIPAFPLRQPRRVSNPETPVAASLVAALLPAGAPGGHVVERVGSGVTAIFLHLDRCSGKHAGQYLAESLGSVAPSIIGFAHGSNHEGSHVREVVKVCREFGNVCRA